MFNPFRITVQARIASTRKDALPGQPWGEYIASIERDQRDGSPAYLVIPAILRPGEWLGIKTPPADNIWALGENALGSGEPARYVEVQDLPEVLEGLRGISGKM